VIAAGKAAQPMLDAFVAASLASLRMKMATGSDTGHPLANAASVAAATRALDIARSGGETDLLVVLLSGGASAKLALPAAGITLADKQQTVRALLEGGADIHQLNTVRKHLSAIKGGQLGAATRAQLMTLVVSDVVGDDLSMIASGPTVPDPTTFADALRALDEFGGRARYPAAVVTHLARGAAGEIAETPKPGDGRFARPRTLTRIIGNRFTALDAARAAAESLGYRVHVIDEPVVGHARQAGPALIAQALTHRSGDGAATCVISTGETTVRVTGTGTGGRNQELALSMLPALDQLGGRTVAASVGTDGIDGPTDAAGAIVDATTTARAAARGLDAAHYLNDNNSYAFFDALDDLIRTGATSTNVGDLQIILTT
jgi:hydroxypyruvate reductase